MIPGIKIDQKFNFGDIQKLLEGIPNDVLLRVGRLIRNEQGQRIKYGGGGTTIHGEKIDQDSPGWLKFKAAKGFDYRPLVLTGTLTEPSAWDIKISGKRVSLMLKGEHHEKWDNIATIAEKTGRNWRDAFGFSETLKEAILGLIARKWLQASGVIPKRKYEIPKDLLE